MLRINQKNYSSNNQGSMEKARSQGSYLLSLTGVSSQGTVLSFQRHWIE